MNQRSLSLPPSSTKSETKKLRVNTDRHGCDPFSREVKGSLLSMRTETVVLKQEWQNKNLARDKNNDEGPGRPSVGV